MDRRGSRLSRRQFMHAGGAAGLGLLAGCGRLPGQAQPPARVPRIGYLGDDGESSNDRAGLRDGLRGLGYVEGESIVIVERYASSDLLQARMALPGLAAELVAEGVDVLVAASVPHTQAAIEATSSIPIVFVLHPDPVGAGHVASLARPGGNVTGTSFFNTPLSGKRLELLKQTLPGAARVAVLGPPEAGPGSVSAMSETRAAAAALGIQLQVLSVRSPEDFDAAFEAILAEQAEAVLLMPGGPLLGNSRILEFITQLRLPSIGTNRRYAERGGLMVYGANFDTIRRRSAYYVDRILRGAKPADLPVEQPMTFDFVVNMKTAQALGLTFPDQIMLQVTEVIQ
jgi:putative tryptophan/tyrosine transport system substrate-binding protein